jgi:hypothetical protein
MVIYTYFKMIVFLFFLLLLTGFLPDAENEVQAQQATVQGQVTDAQTGELLPGVNVVVQGTSTGTATNLGWPV